MISNLVIMITGASSGIGYATALAFSKAGAKVAIGARRTDRLEKLENEIKKNGGKVFFQKLDVTQKSESISFVESIIKKWGTIDILINNAGTAPLSLIKNLKIDEWDQMIDVNIKGVLYCCETHTMGNTHLDIHIQRERLTDKERHKHTERQTQ